VPTGPARSGTPKGTLRIRGSIAQHWRGAVGQFSGRTSVSGYAKDPAEVPRPGRCLMAPDEQAELAPAFPG